MRVHFNNYIDTSYVITIEILIDISIISKIYKILGLFLVSAKLVFSWLEILSQQSFDEPAIDTMTPDLSRNYQQKFSCRFD